MCTHEVSKCIDSRPFTDCRNRRYRCVDCGHVWSTIEIPIKEGARDKKFVQAAKSQFTKKDIRLKEQQTKTIKKLEEENRRLIERLVQNHFYMEFQIKDVLAGK
jgi:transcriptional regulator NrdR family protein